MMKRISNFWFNNLGTFIAFSIPLLGLFIMWITWLITNNFDKSSIIGLFAMLVIAILTIPVYIVLAVKVFNPERKLRQYERYIVNEKKRLDAEGPLSKLLMFNDGAGI
jgi:hypothetical protein